MLSISLGLKKNGVPPYLQRDLLKNDLITGVCFASGGTGYDELTSTISGVISMKEELEYFKEYLSKIKDIVGGNSSEVERIVNGALVIVSAGTNDLIFNFYDLPNRRLQFSLSGYQDFLLDKVQSFIKELYYLGCRNIIVNGLPPIGCLPMQITAKSPFFRSCINDENLDAQIYNEKLQDLLIQLQSHLPGSKILYVDTYNFIAGLIHNPQLHEGRVARKDLGLDLGGGVGVGVGAGVGLGLGGGSGSGAGAGAGSGSGSGSRSSSSSSSSSGSTSSGNGNAGSEAGSYAGSRAGSGSGNRGGSSEAGSEAGTYAGSRAGSGSGN
uniref:GDSL esterase/lipase n=1 Tax=Solanum tuberosum TaxID=4113 RepID=M1AD44_SOLTU